MKGLMYNKNAIALASETCSVYHMPAYAMPLVKHRHSCHLSCTLCINKLSTDLPAAEENEILHHEGNSQASEGRTYEGK